MSKAITVQLYGAPGNNAVVKMPERRNAGVVVQADTLHSLAMDAREIAERLKVVPVGSDLSADAQALADTLASMFDALKAALEREGETVAV
jgi:hypothetical protein